MRKDVNSKIRKYNKLIFSNKPGPYYFYLICTPMKIL